MIDEGLEVPDAYAVWKIHPDHYNHSEFPARGGVLYHTLPSPTMVAFDGLGNAFISLDRVPKVLRIDTGTRTGARTPSRLRGP